jgi:hypothetical protein
MWNRRDTALVASAILAAAGGGEAFASIVVDTGPLNLDNVLLHSGGVYLGLGLIALCFALRGLYRHDLSQGTPKAVPWHPMQHSPFNRRPPP